MPNVKTYIVSALFLPTDYHRLSPTATDCHRLLPTSHPIWLHLGHPTLPTGATVENIDRRHGNGMHWPLWEDGLPCCCTCCCTLHSLWQQFYLTFVDSIVQRPYVRRWTWSKSLNRLPVRLFAESSLCLKKTVTQNRNTGVPGTTCTRSCTSVVPQSLYFVHI